jgi:endonuclease YncB( thermonuclease family)
LKLRPSRIRRDPVPLESSARVRKAEIYSHEREMWSGVAGVLLFTLAIVVVTVGISVATIFRNDPAAAARAAQFGQCYNALGPNCVFDGGTIYIGGVRVEIAGVDAPEIQDARCPEERTRGIEAASRLADLLNSGRVTVSGTFRDKDGRDVRSVQVKGHDIGPAMISAGLAKSSTGADRKPWC